jgi:hypothetical protein
MTFGKQLTALGTEVVKAYFFETGMCLTFPDVFTAQGSGGTAAVFDDVPGVAG